MNAQIIEKDGRPEWAVIPYADYRRLLELAEARWDIEVADAASAAVAAGEEVVPGVVVDRLAAGEPPLRVWREYRGLALATLASRTGLAEALLDQLDVGACDGSQAQLAALAAALDLDPDDLTPWS